MRPDLLSMGEAVRRLNPQLFPKPVAGCPDPMKGEADLHESIIAECRRRGWVYLHGSMAERTHRTQGEPDFIILADEGRVLLVECKSATGKLSPAQAAMHAHAAKLGHTVHVVRSFSQFQQVIS